jgi:hypothetical protein
MNVELADDATKQEIDEYVDDMIAETKDARQGGGDPPEEKQVAAGDSEDENAGDSEDETGESDWLDDDLKAEVAAYGIDEKELEEFTSREELDRALRFFDRKAMDDGKKKMAEKPDDKPETEESPESGKYEISLDKDMYEDDLIDEFTKLRDHYESRLGALETHFAEANASAEEQRFDSLIDSLGHAELFGKTGKENSKQLQRREDVLIAAKAQKIGLESMGRKVELDKSLVSRVTKMVFSDELSKKEIKSRTIKLTKQSNGRQGGGATRPTDTPETVNEQMRQLYKELDGS